MDPALQMSKNDKTRQINKYKVDFAVFTPDWIISQPSVNCMKSGKIQGYVNTTNFSNVTYGDRESLEILG